jgi:hypothetical protein
VSQVSADSLRAAAERLVGFGTRYTGSDSNAAAAKWLGERLDALGYQQVRFDTFIVNVDKEVSVEVDGGTEVRHFVHTDVAQWNVTAVRPGVLYPDRRIVLGSHYDTIALDRPPDAQDVAPGADDNASGVAACLEIARILRRSDLDATLVLAFFGAEELGLLGSRHFASQARDRGDEILMMLGLDAIGTRSRLFPDAFTIDTIGPYFQLGDVLGQAAEDYTEVRARDGAGGRVLITDTGCGCSDHQSFIDNGYPGLAVFQYIQNPELHLNTSVDTLGGLDFSLIEGVTKAVLASVVLTGGYPGRSPDFDGDGRVAYLDFLLFASKFDLAVSGGEDARFDLDRDGHVGFSDFTLFAGNYGRTLAPR